MDIKMLLEHLKNAYGPDGWRLFIYSSKQSIKLSFDIKKCYSIDTKETYEIVENISKVMKCEDLNYRICGDSDRQTT